MLALLLRGVFFMGVVGWYSAGIWKMIDGYFKERFERYLQEEYQKNPKMHEDVLVYGAVDKLGRVATDQSGEAEARRFLDSCDPDSCPVGEAGCATPGMQRGPQDESVSHAKASGADAAGKEVVRTVYAAGSDVQEETEPPDRKADSVFLVESNSSLVKDEQDREEQEQVDSHFEILQEQQSQSETRNEPFLQLVQETDEDIRNREEAPSKVEKKSEEKGENEKVKKRGIQRRRKAEIVAKPKEGDKRKKTHKKKIHTVTLTVQDFDFVRWHRRSTSDAREFDEFNEERNRAPGDKFQGDEEDNAGIAVTDLPFKPAIDVYNLERVSGEEFCPLTLDDDPSCEETRGWP